MDASLARSLQSVELGDSSGSTSPLVSANGASSSGSNSGMKIESLPPEIMLKILTHLLNGDPTAFRQASQVSRKFRDYSITVFHEKERQIKNELDRLSNLFREHFLENPQTSENERKEFTHIWVKPLSSKFDESGKYIGYLNPMDYGYERNALVRLKELETFGEVQKKALVKFFSAESRLEKLPESLRFEIAKIELIQYQTGFVNLFPIEKYVLQNEENRFELALISFNIYPNAFLFHIHRFNLNEGQRFEIAKRDAFRNQLAVSRFISMYKINEDQRYEVAKISAAEDIVQTINNIDTYHLSEKLVESIILSVPEQNRFEALKKSDIHPESLPTLTKKLQLSDEHIFELVKIVAAKHPAFFTQNILHEFELDQDQRYELAKAVAASDVSTSAQFIEKFELNEVQRYELAKITIASDPAVTIRNIDKYQLSEEHAQAVLLSIEECDRFNAIKYLIIRNREKIASEILDMCELTPEHRQEVETMEIPPIPNNEHIAQNRHDYSFSDGEMEIG